LIGYSSRYDDEKFREKLRNVAAAFVVPNAFPVVPNGA